MPADPAADDDDESYTPVRKKGKNKKGSKARVDASQLAGKAATPAKPAAAAGPAEAPTAVKSGANAKAPTATANKGDGKAAAASKGDGKAATAPSKGDGKAATPKGKGPPAGQAAGGQPQDLEGAVARVLDKLLPDKLALALAQHPQGPRPLRQAAPQSQWPCLPRAASSAVPPTGPGTSVPQPIPQAAPPPPPQWTPNPLLPDFVPGAAPKFRPQTRRVVMPAEGAAIADGLHCPICNKFVRGGASALRAHQAASSTCLAMAGDAAYGREPCEFCGKMLAANDHWAKKQHSVFCSGQQQARPSSGPPPNRWRPGWRTQQWHQPTDWQRNYWY